MIWSKIRYFFTGRYATPRVIQMEAVECGAAALSIIMSYYGVYRSLEELRVKCGVSRSGVNAYNMVQAARFYGFEADGYEVSLEELKTVDLPTILYWDQNHFVVLEGLSRRWAYINDPATGPRKIHRQELARHFSNVIIQARPGKDFEKQGEAPSLWRSIAKRMAPNKQTLALIFVLQIALILFGLAIPIAYQIFIDAILMRQFLTWKWEFLAFLTAIMLVISALTWIKGKILNFLQIRLAIQYSTKFFWHILQLPIQFFTQRYGGEIIHRMQLNNRVAKILTGDIILAVINVLFIGIYGFIIYQYDAVIASIAVAAALFDLAALASINRMRTNAYASLQQEQAKTIGVSLDALQNIESIKTSVNDQSYFSRLAGYYTKMINANQEIGRKDIWLNTFVNLAQQISTILLFAIGVWRVMYGNLTIGMLIALKILLNYFISPFGQLVNFGTTVQSLHVDLNRLDDVLQNQQDPIVLVRAKENTPGPTSIRFRDVSFNYAPLDDPILEKIDFTLSPGKWIGLIGKVGSGKSTIAKMAAGLYSPDTGEILYDDKTIDHYSRESFKSSLAYVDQQIILFSGTVRDNLTLWDRTIPQEDVVRAAKDACIYDEIMARGNQFHAELIENGRNFSEGQRQRLEIARALVQNPNILILDEATSALDAETEEKVIQNLKERNISCIMIAHRLGTVQYCDEILVLENRKITQSGSPEQLKNEPGLYQKLLQAEER